MTDEHDHPNEHPRHFATNPGHNLASQTPAWHPHTQPVS
jgi:hypothetical protein